MTKASTSFAALAKRLWLALMLVVCTVTAAKAADIEMFELNTPYEVKGIFASKKMSFTPEKDMLLKVCFVGSGSVSFYNSDSFDYTDAVSDAEHAYEINKIGDVEYSRRYQLTVSAGTTYYIKADCSSSSTSLQFIGIEESNTFEVKAITFGGNEGKDGGAISASKQLEVEFTKKPSSDKYAVFTWGSVSKEIEVHTGSSSLIVKTQSVVDSIMNLAENPAKEGDKVSVSFTNVKDSKENLYNGDGKLTLNFTIPATPATIANTDEVDAWMNEGFRSYWVSGDKGGILTVEYTRDLKTYAEGQTAQVSLLFGYQGGTDDNVQYSFGKADGAYDRVTIDGNKLIVDFTGILYEPKYTYINLSLYNVLMADGTQPSYSSKTYITYHPEFKDMTTDLAYEFTPANGSTLTSNEIELYLSEKTAITFTSVEISYQTQNDEKKTESITEFTSKEDETEGSNAISYFFKVSDDVKAGKNVRVSLGGVVAIDGKEHTVSAKFNPGDELLSDITLVKNNPKTGLTYEVPKSLAITFSEAVSVADASKCVLTDETTGKACEFTVANAGVSTLAFSSEFADGHEYTLTIDAAAVGNEQFVSTNGKYGNYYVGGEFNYTFCSSCKGYDFLTNPRAGSTVDKLATVEFLPKSDASSDAVSYNSGFSYDNEEYADPIVYAILKSEYDAAESTTWTNGSDSFTTKADADVVKAAKITHPAIAKDKDGNGQGFTVTFADPIVKAGEYYIVFQYGTFSYGDGLDSGFNDSEVTVPFSVSGNADFSCVATPSEDDETLETIQTIKVKFDKAVSMVDDPVVYVYGARRVTGTVEFDSVTNTATITLSKELTAGDITGNLNIQIPEGIFYNASGFENGDIYLSYTLVKPASTATLVAEPADGSTVTSISEILFYFNDEEGNPIEDVMAASGKVSVKRNGVLVESLDPEINYADEDLSHLYLYPSKEYTKAGVYTFEFPRGVISINDGEESAAATLTYTIGTVSKEFSYTADPADGSELEALQTIKLTFSEPVSVTENATVNVYGAYGVTGTLSAADNVVTIALSDAVDYYYVMGRFGVQIAAGSIEDANGTYNSEAIYLGYDFTEPAAETPEIEATPADGSTVETISNIGFQITNYVDVASADATDETAVVVKKDGVEVGTARIDYSDDWSDPNLYIFYETAEAGEYTFEVREGALNYDYDQVVPAFTLTYTVTGSMAIHNVTFDAANGDIYDLAGRKIAQPARGLYISGGKLQLKK